ncbi:MAG: MFS transporter, partial [Chloroflexota bacterium]
MSSYPPSRSLTDRLVDFFGLSISVLSLIFFIRFVNNVGVRIVYPFVPQLASGLGLTMVGVSWLLSIRSLVGVVGPVFGVWADRYGQREILAFSLIGHGLGLMWLTFVQGWTAILPFILIGISIAVLIPTLQAYVSNIVPYHRRGRSLAAVEFTWALAGIIGLPVAGIMMDRLGWRMPFWLLSVLCLIGGLLIWFRLPSELDIQTGQPDAKKVTKSFNFFQLCKRPNVLASIGVALCNSLALSCFLTTWGVWLNQAFTFEATALGFVATAISVAELGGSGLSSLFIDRVGKRRGSMIGVLGVLGLFLLLPQVSQW